MTNSKGLNFLKTEVCLVRHGCTDWNIENRTQGWSDIPLNELGVSQAHEIALSLKNQNWEAVISSDLKRAKQTAEIIANKLNIPLFLFDKLRERNHGVLEGKTMDEILMEYPEITFSSNLPGREPLKRFMLRTNYAFSTITKIFSGRKIIVVTHGGVIRTFYAVCLHCSKNYWANAKVAILQWENGKWLENN